MGLDIGIISVRYLERPRGSAYDFAWQLAHEASLYGYMYGEGNNWGAFTQRQVLHMLDDFAERRGLDAPAKDEVLAWVRLLPWIGWKDDLYLTPGDTIYYDDYNPLLDSHLEQQGGFIELHFNW